jgi:hypothetical protein
MSTRSSHSIQFGFWDLDQRLNPDLRKSLEVFYYRIPCVSDAPYPMLWDSDVDRLITKASDIDGLEWLCVTAVGTMFAGQDRIFDAVRNEIEALQAPTLVVGQPVEKDGKYPGLNEQMFLVNLKLYRELGNPSFGGYETGSKNLKNYVSDSTLLPAAGFAKHKVWTCGWGFVHSSLEAGMPIAKMSVNLWREKVYAYPDDEIEKLNRNLELFYRMEDMRNPSQNKLLGYLFNKRFGLNPKWKGSDVNLVPREPTVFLFNTEEMLPNAAWVGEVAAPLDYYMGPSAGFLEVAALFAHGFKVDTRLVYYDYNPASLAAKKRMLADWSGDLETLQAVVLKIAADDPHRTYHMGNFDQEAGKLLKIFGSAENLRQTWQRVQELPKQFVELNLLNEHRELLSLAPQDRQGGARGVVAISDIFTGQNELLYGHTVIRLRYQSFIENARAIPGLIVSGKDLKGMPFATWSSELPGILG